jgi:UDP-N-acetylmuramate--alanine ligase
MDFDQVHNVYFLGIGGIGMSALARYFHASGKNVSGYDLSPSSVTADLEALGIDIHFEQNIQLVASSFLNKANTMVVLTPAVPSDHAELIYFQQNGFTIKKRAEVLGVIFNAKKGIAISGTHGKTSVTSMTAFIMQQSHVGCSAFLGGILKNINSNLIIDNKSKWVVAEADEFDRSFLQLKPEIALVTWVDSDHMDIYSSHDEIIETFEKFLSQVHTEGKIILKKGIDLNFDRAKREIYTYSLDSVNSDFYALNISDENGKYTFDINTPDSFIKDITLPYPGMTNVENAVAAASVAYLAGVDIDTISDALCEFEGVQRRFDIQVDNGNCIYIDDYAHHPRELDAIIGSVRKLYPDRKITGIFQPHLYSRTRDFADDFAVSLSALDELLLLDIYPAREKPIPGISSSIIFENVTCPNKKLIKKQDLLSEIDNRDIDILITMGAGDIDRYVSEIKKLLENR